MMICIFVLIGTLLLNYEIKKHNENSDFFLSGTMATIQVISQFNCGENIENFDEQNLMSLEVKYDDFQGSTWAPSLIPIKTWRKVGGFSEEYSPWT